MPLKSKTAISPELRWLLCWISLCALLGIVLAIGTGQHWAVVLLAWFVGSLVGAAIGGYFNAVGR